MRELTAYSMVFLGGGLGAVMRHAANRAGSAIIGPGSPASTLFVNVAGCLLLGLIAGWFAFRGEAPSASLRLFLITGICGGFKTFSAFTLDAWTLWQRGDHLVSGGYVVLSFTLSLAALLLGLFVGRALFST